MKSPDLRPEPAAAERIHKRLAEAGLGSRRTIEQWIREGRVTVNGQTATLGQKVGARDRVGVDGRAVHLPSADQPTRVLLYKKRVGEIVTRADSEGRRTVFRKLPRLEAGRWIAVGRLDINTSGMLLMTNDGELARRLTHPSFEIQRTYAVRVLGVVNDALLQRLREGVELDDGPVRCDRVVRGAAAGSDDANANHWLYVTVHEGRNRLVRRLFESQDLQVSRLMRVAYGPIELGGGIRSGSARELVEEEVEALLTAVGLQQSAPTVGRSPSKGRTRVPPVRHGKTRPAGSSQRGTAGKNKSGTPHGGTGSKPRMPR